MMSCHIVALAALVYAVGVLARPPPDIEACSLSMTGTTDAGGIPIKETMTMIYDRRADHGYTTTSVRSDVKEANMDMIDWVDHKNGKCYSAMSMGDGDWDCSVPPTCDPVDKLIPEDAKHVRTTSCIEDSTSSGKKCDVFLLPGPTSDMLLYITADDDVISGFSFDIGGKTLVLAVTSYSKTPGPMPPIPESCKDV